MGADRARAPRPTTADAIVFACVRTSCAIVAEDERDAGAAPGPQPRPHGRPRDRGRDRLRALPPRRGGRRSACWRRCGSPSSRELRDEVASCSAATGCRPALDADRRRESCSAHCSATRSATARAGSASSCSTRPGDARPGARWSTRRRSGRRGGVGGDEHGPQPRRGPARRQLRHARAPRPGEHYGGLTLGELERRSSRLGARAGAGTIFFQTNPEGEFVEYLHRLAGPRRRVDRQRRRLDPLQPRDRRRARGRRAARGRGPPLRRRVARGVAPASRSSTASSREGLRQGRRRLPRGAGAAAARAGLCAPSDATAPTALATLLAERELDLLLVTDLVNVRYLTGFTGTNGALRRRAATRGSSSPTSATPSAAERGRGLGRRRSRRRLARRRSPSGCPKAAAARLRGRPHVGPGATRSCARSSPTGSSWSPPAAWSRSCARSRTRTSWSAIRAAARARRRGSGAGVLERGLAGRTEREVARAARGTDARARAPRPVVSGDRRRRPERRAAARRAARREIGRGELVVFDMGRQARRLLLRRHPHVRHRRARRARRARSTSSCCEAQQAALDAVAAGRRRRARSTRSPAKVIDAAGHGERFGHGLGHGVGLEVHEGPRLSQRSDDVARGRRSRHGRAGHLPARASSACGSRTWWS